MFAIQSFTGGFTQTNGYLLRRTDGSGCLLIDAPEGISAWLQEQDTKIDALLLTHQHFDHVLDAAAVKDFHRCPIYAFAAYAADLTLEALLSAAGMPVRVPPFEVDHLLAGQSKLKAGNLEMELLHVPGHSPDSVCFRPLEATADGEAILVGGDVLFRGSIGRTDFPHSDHAAFIQGIHEKLFKLPAETIVYPGHGPWTTIRDEMEGNPYL